MNIDLLDSRIFSSAYLEQTSVAWHKFLERGDCPSGSVRAAIRRSWLRSKEAGASSTTPDFMAEALRTTACADLIDAAKEAVEPVYDVIRKSGSLFLVTDPDGNLISCSGEPETMKLADELNIRTGAKLAEAFCGTNAVGMTLLTRRPAQVNATEHFCEIFKQLSCSAGVVRDRVDGSIVGAVDITGVSKKFHLHSLALVVSLTNHIETILTMRTMEAREKLLQWSRLRFESAASSKLIVLDIKGRPFSLTGAEPAKAILTAPHFEVPIRQARAWLQAWNNGEATDLDIDTAFYPCWHNGKVLGMAIIGPGGHATRVRSAPERTVGPVLSPSQDQQGFRRLISKSTKMNDVVKRAQRLARYTTSVLIEGETGVGKEEIARAIHEASPVWQGPYVAVNCGAIPRELIASELFGYVDGAFTGAKKGGAAGKFELADRGTLFLDEIGELALDAQAYLLRVLEDGVVYRIGAIRGHSVGVRILAATNRNLRLEAANGRFREDLYYRLSVAAVRVPPLRDRREDIGSLCDRLLEDLCREHGIGRRIVDRSAIAILESYDWPGNVRELRNLLERILVLTDSATITGREIAAEILDISRHESMSDMYLSEDNERREKSLRNIEETAIKAAIVRNEGNLVRVAKELGIARSTLYEKLMRYGIRPTV